MVDKTDIHPNRSSQRYVTLFALVELILRLAQREALKGQHEITREVLNRRNVIKDVLQTFIKEPLVAVPLDIQQMRHLHDFLDFSIAIPGSFAYRHRIK
jgi:hypothetical protein